jgi:hypothetical protein
VRKAKVGPAEFELRGRWTAGLKGEKMPGGGEKERDCRVPHHLMLHAFQATRRYLQADGWTLDGTSNEWGRLPRTGRGKVSSVTTAESLLPM